MIVIKGPLVPSKKLRKELARLPVTENGYFEVVDGDPVRRPANSWQLQEETRPFDWQDKVVITACVATVVICILLMVWGPR